MRVTSERSRPPSYGLHYFPKFVSAGSRAETIKWLSTLRPIWEQRYSKHSPPPPTAAQRWLLRPVYWLGNWQFACLNYYHPPKGILNRCVEAEPFPAPLQTWVQEIEKSVKRLFRRDDIPSGWKLNTCLVNFYGTRLHGGKKIDGARVGEHRDFEPGPVASVSLGERALFQFVYPGRRGERTRVACQEWLEDGSLQVFGGRLYKDILFHRVQRVEKKSGNLFPISVPDYETRRVNFTFRYVPDKHILPFRDLPQGLAEDVSGYVRQLAQSSQFFRKAYQDWSGRQTATLEGKSSQSLPGPATSLFQAPS